MTTSIQNPTSRVKGAADAFLTFLARRPWRTLLVVYIAAAIIRQLLCFAAGELPSIQPDELRYLHAARSIYARGEILFRGQPVRYQYILYPLLIGPLFDLPRNFNVYRLIQVFNSLCMTATLFPAFALAKELTGSKKTSLLLAALVLVLPDMALARNVMNEAVAYPLVMTALLVMVRAFRSPDRRGLWLLTGALCFLLYTLKPVYVTLGGACVLVCAADALRKRDKTRLASVALMALVMALGYAAYQALLRFGLNADMSQTELYASQTSAFTLAHVVQTIGGLSKYATYHLLAFGVLPFAAAFRLKSRLADSHGMLAGVLLLAVGLSVVVTVYIIYVDELIHQGGVPLRVHTRYAALYFPAFIMLLYTPEAKNMRLARPGIALAAVTLVGCVCYGTSEFDPAYHYPVDSMLMAMLHYDSGAWHGLGMWLPLYGSALAACVALALREGLTRWARRLFMCVMLISLCLNAYAAWDMNGFGAEPLIDADAKQAAALTGGDAWMVSGDGEGMYAASVAMDVHSRCDIPCVTLDELLRCTDDGGVARALTPDAYADYVHTQPAYAVSPRSYLIFDAALMNALVPAQTPAYTEHLKYAYIDVSGGRPWLHSGLFGLTQNWVAEGSRFLLYDATLRAQERVELRLKLRAGTEGATLTMRTDDGQAFTLTPSADAQTQWYAASFLITDPAAPLCIDFSHEGGNIYIETYTIS